MPGTEGYTVVPKKKKKRHNPCIMGLIQEADITAIHIHIENHKLKIRIMREMNNLGGKAHLRSDV